MTAAAQPPDEKERLTALRSLDILDTPETTAFDEIARLAAQIGKVPIALVSLVDAERQWSKAHHGLATRETRRDEAFCAHAILTPRELFVVPDARLDARFRDNPFVTGAPGMVFYAATPLVVDGRAIGTLCLFDRAPHEIDAEAREALRILGNQVEARLTLERALREKDQAITGLVRAQTDVARTACVVDGMRQAVLVYARDHEKAPFRLVSRNQAALENASSPENTMIGRHAREVMPPLLGAQLAAQLEAAVTRAGQSVMAVRELRGRTYQVDTITLSPDAVAIVAEDITQRVAFERSKDEFLAIAAHELRTPLSGMIGALGLLASGAMGELSELALEAVTIAETSALRLNRLTTDMLDLETMRQGRLKLRPARVAIRELVAMTLPPLLAAATQAGVGLTSAGALDAAIQIDFDRIAQALTSLVVNAIRYAPRGTQVALTATPIEGAMRIEVADEGCGVSATDQARLFSRFVQIEASEKRPHQGTGLGLAIVKALVELHGGRVGVESDPSARPGSRFWIELPSSG